MPASGVALDVREIWPQDIPTGYLAGAGATGAAAAAPAPAELCNKTAETDQIVGSVGYARRIHDKSAPAALERPGAGTEGGPSMRSNRTADEAGPSGTVHGLGVSDALRLELLPVQVSWLRDELDEIRGPLEETRQLAMASSEAELLEETEYRLRLLRKMRGELPAGEPASFVLFTGPSAMVLDVVGGTMQNVVASLAELVDQRVPSSSLRDTAAAAYAWVETYLDCKAVEGFNFDRDSDPFGQW